MQEIVLFLVIVRLVRTASTVTIVFYSIKHYLSQVGKEPRYNVDLGEHFCVEQFLTFGFPHNLLMIALIVQGSVFTWTSVNVTLWNDQQELCLTHGE